MWLITAIKSQPLVGKPGSLNCHAHRHNVSSIRGLDLPPSGLRELHTDPKKEILIAEIETVNISKCTASICLIRDSWTWRLFFLWFMYKLKLHTIAALAFKCKQNILEGCHSMCWRVGLWTLRCERRATETSSCLRIRARHGVCQGKGSVEPPCWVLCPPPGLSIHALGHTEDASSGPRLPSPPLESAKALESCLFSGQLCPSRRLSGKPDLHSTSSRAGPWARVTRGSRLKSTLALKMW